MPAGIYPIFGKLFDTDGSTAISSGTVKVRNENTNEILSETTNSNGEFVFELGNLPSGWTDGDKITVYVIYRNFDASITVTIDLTNNPDGIEQNLTLTAIAGATIKLFTVQEFLEYHGLSDSNSDSQNGIKTQTIVNMGEGIEKNIERITNRTWDDNSGNNYQITDELYEVRLSQKIWFTRKTPITSIQRFEVNVNLPGEDPDFQNIAFQQLDAADAVTGWSATTDGSITLNTTNGEVNEGTGALNITKTGATVDNVTYDKTLSSQFDFTNSNFKMDLFVEDTSELASQGSTQVEIRVGTDSSNYYSKTFDNIAQGNWISLSLRHNSTDSSASTTGTPNATAVDYVAIKITYASSSTTVSAGDMRLDNIRFNEENDLDINKEIGRIAIATHSDFRNDLTVGHFFQHFITFPEPGLDQVRITYKHGQTVPADIKRLAILMTARGLGSQMLGALNMKVSESSGLNSSLQNLNNYDKEIEMIIENRRFAQIENVLP